MLQQASYVPDKQISTSRQQQQQLAVGQLAKLFGSILVPDRRDRPSTCIAIQISLVLYLWLTINTLQHSIKAVFQIVTKYNLEDSCTWTRVVAGVKSPGHVHQSPGFTSCLCSGLRNKSKFG